MPKTVAISELKARCLKLIDEVAQRRAELIVTKRGKPIARVVPLDELPGDDPLERLRGTVIGGDRVEDFDTGVVWESMRR